MGGRSSSPLREPDALVGNRRIRTGDCWDEIDCGRKILANLSDTSKKFAGLRNVKAMLDYLIHLVLPPRYLSMAEMDAVSRELYKDIWGDLEEMERGLGRASRINRELEIRFRGNRTHTCCVRVSSNDRLVVSMAVIGEDISTQERTNL
jgi:hypothetical protein